VPRRAPRLAGSVPSHYPPFRKSLPSGFVVVGIIVDSLVDVLADVLADILADVLSDVLSDVLVDVLVDILVIQVRFWSMVVPWWRSGSVTV
jgi:hypothetical protein